MVARLDTTIECVPTRAVVWAVAVTMPGCDEVADCAVRGPCMLASESTAAARFVRLLFSPVNIPACVDKSVCWFGNREIEPLFGPRIAFTTDETFIPLPFNRAAALKLTAIFVSFSPANAAEMAPGTRLKPAEKNTRKRNRSRFLF